MADKIQNKMGLITSINVVDLAPLLIYATRYAMGRHTYASGEVAEIVAEFATIPDAPTRHILIKDIQDALDKHEVDELSTHAWRTTLDKLTKVSDLANTSPKDPLKPLKSAPTTPKKQEGE